MSTPAAGVSSAVLSPKRATLKDLAWKAQWRLHTRYQKAAARGKNKNQIVTAVGRELLGFIWAIGVQAERQVAQTH